MVFVADALGGWLVEQLADAGRKKLTGMVLGTEQERALRRAADVAALATAEEVSRSGGAQAGQVAMVISEVFRDPVPDAPLAGPVMLLAGLQAGIAEQLAVLDDAELTGIEQSSADVMGVPGAVLADRLTAHLVREIIVRGSGGGPLAPLADQFNHELTRLQIGGMLAQLAAEIRDALARPGSGMTVAGWPLAEVTNPFALEVHRPVDPDVPRPGLPVLPVYVRRKHDAALAEVVSAASAGTSGIAVLVAGSSTGKTRACWQALELLRGLTPRWRLWHPIDSQGALADMAGIGPQTVVWLNEAQRCLGPADGTGERVAAGLRTLLRDRTRGPVLALATLWPEYWDQLTARPPGGADPHAQARELLAGHDIPVPAAFTSEQLRQLEGVRDPRLAQAAAGSRDGQVIQYLAGAPELLHRYHNAPPAAGALIDAAMDARRVGMGPALPRAFLETAAPGYLTDTDWDLLPGDWLEQGLGYTKRPAKGVRGALAPIRPRPRPGLPADPDDGQAWQLADYLDQHGRRARRELTPPASFWAAAARYADPADLGTLGSAAEDRGLYRDAARLYKQASGHGNTAAGARLVQLLHTLHPSDQRPADWAAAHASLDDPRGVALLLATLRKVEATSQVTMLLAREPAAHVSIDEALAVGLLLDALDEVGASDQITMLLARDPAAHASFAGSLGTDSLLSLFGKLLKVGATDQIATLAKRMAAHVSLDDLGGVGVLLYGLRRVGATDQITTLLARDPAAHARLDDLRDVLILLGALREVGGTAQFATLTDRLAADARLDDPGQVAELLPALFMAGATDQLATLLARDPTAHCRLDNPHGVGELLGALQRLGFTDQVPTLLARDPAAHARLDNPHGVAELLDTLRLADATDQVTSLLARDPAAHCRLDNPRGVGELLGALQRLEAADQIDTLANRAAAHAHFDNQDNVAYLLDAMWAAGAGWQAAQLIKRLPTAGMFQLFCRQGGLMVIFRFGRTTDGRPAEPWAWTDLG